MCVKIIEVLYESLPSWYLEGIMTSAAPDNTEQDLPGDSQGEDSVARRVRITLLQAAAMQSVAERAKEIAERIGKLTPPPEKPEAEHGGTPE